MGGKSTGKAKGDAGPHTLAIDIGGTGLKASVLDKNGNMIAEEVRIDTPYPCPPKVMLESLEKLVEPLPSYDRISVGFPGVVGKGKVITAPHFGNRVWCDFPLADELSKRLGRPVRLLNDAEVQGFGVIVGRGLEVVLTLGTGAGTAVFREGELMPHLELAQHPIGKWGTYNDYVGDKALKKKGKRKWNRRVEKTVAILYSLLHFDVLYIGGGNARKIEVVPDNVIIVPNEAGITGGVKLWRAPRGQGAFAHEAADRAASPVAATAEAVAS
ncbi:MAG: chromosome partitioning protein ParA [Rhizobiales bacterium 65-79]|jgi:polyphosphate glucokinase|nr:ROK family protein [Hyphomicrobiales bacterium]OJU02766.1 MAG: chromosome partitioning protein ParA [Rhizobiales bacterium 65-79]